MKLYSSGKSYKLYQGNMLDMLEVIEPNSIDSIVTDPPYELGFMNKGWDASGIAFQKESWEKCFKVLKPGGYLLSFGGSRTFHRIACAIEDAGFEIRDTIMYLYGSGFPKSMNLGKSIESKLVNGSANTQDWKNLKGTKVQTGDWGVNANAYEYGARPSDYSEDGHLRVDKVDYQTKEGKQWDGWGTCLKPAYEPIILARKPCEGSTTDNVLKYGVGGINIDGCRIPLESNYVYKECNRHSRTNNVFTDDTSGFKSEDNHTAVADPNGRFPSNVILTYDETDYDEVCGGMPDTKSNGGLMTMPDFKDAGQKNSQNKIGFNDGDTAGRKQSDYFAPIDSGSAARYFYCAKASKRDRDEGLSTHNTHCTVKPVDLMQYLVRLVTPKGGTVLDPFNGSGSTGKACIYENKELEADYKYIGIELTEEYLPIADARIKYAEGKKIQGRLLL